VYPPLKYQPQAIRLKQTTKEVVHIFDIVRKKWLLLSPEEWVRQHLVHHLIHQKHYSPALISLEKEIELNGTKKRYDVVVYNANLSPMILIECKAADVELNEAVLEQALRYNLKLEVPYVMITNGIQEVILKANEVIMELPSAISVK
jgi:hypothetical protein